MKGSQRCHSLLLHKRDKDCAKYHSSVGVHAGKELGAMRPRCTVLPSLRRIQHPNAGTLIAPSFSASQNQVQIHRQNWDGKVLHLLVHVQTS